MMIDIAGRLQHTPGGECKQADYYDADQHVTERLTQQGFKTAMTVCGLRGTLRRQYGEQTDDQIDNTTSGVTASCKHDKAALRRHKDLP